MNRLLIVLALGTPLAAVTLGTADEIPHLDFVRALRAHDYPDLALEYLDKLRASKPSPDVAALIPLETAKVRLDLAGAETDVTRRLDLYNKARSAFAEFVAKNPENPEAAGARLEIAHVASLQAKTHLSRALRQDNPTTALSYASTARQLFAEANKQYQTLIRQLDKQLADSRYADPQTPQLRSEKKTLEQARLQAELDLGLNYIDQAQTFIDESKDETLRQRAETIKQAIPPLEKLGSRDARSPFCWQAHAWLGHCYHQNGDPKKARQRLGAVIEQTDPVALAGKRLARYFRMLIIQESPEPADGNPLENVRGAAERWLSDYRGFVSTPEGCGVRYILAKTYIDLATKSKEPVSRRQALARARELSRGLQRPENDFTEKARSLLIRVVREEGGFTKPIAELPTFDDCFIRTLWITEQLNQLSRKKDAKPEEAEKQRKELLDSAIEALKRGLVLAQQKSAKVAQAEINHARALLTGYFLFTNRFKEAIEVGEPAARIRPATHEAADTAVYVLQAYSDLISTSLRDGAPLVDLEPDSKKLYNLADYVETTWPQEHAGNMARHQRGLMLIREKKPVEALQTLGKVESNYPGIIFVKYQMAKAAFQAAQERAVQAKAEPGRKKQLEEEESRLEQQAIKALQTMPLLPEGADPMTTAVFLDAKVELTRALYKARQFPEIDKLLDPLLTALEKGEMQLDTDKSQAESKAREARIRLMMFKLYGKYGQADAAFAAGNAAKVREITAPIIAGIKKGDYPELKEDATLRWGLTGLALRVEIQEGNTAAAQDILQALQNFTSQDKGDSGSRAILQQLVLMVEKQVREIRKKKDPALLKKTIASFGSFLDILSRQQKTPTPEFLRVLAEAYFGLEMYDKALTFARQVPEPQGVEGQPPEPRQVGNYRFCKLLEVKCLRLSNQLDEAEKALQAIRETPWGKENFEAEKERIHLLAARGLPGRAFTEWNKVVGTLVRKLSQPGAKDQYFECYYYSTECYYKWALSLPEGQKRTDAIKRAANSIVKLESSWPDLGGEEMKARFTDLLEREAALKEQYDNLKGGSK